LAFTGTDWHAFRSKPRIEPIFSGQGEKFMIKQPVVVRLKTGLHARPAALFVQEANKFSAEIFVEKGDKKVNAKSIMGIMSLAISSGTEVVISAEGSDAEQAVNALVQLVSKEELENQ
jgi:catabolite repression HPr-like protein